MWKILQTLIQIKIYDKFIENNTDMMNDVLKILVHCVCLEMKHL